MSHRLVILVSPYTAPTSDGFECNIQYAMAALRDCLLRGEAPHAPHLLYTFKNVLLNENEWKIGIAAMFAWRQAAAATVVYTDLGISQEMKGGIADAEQQGNPIEYRSISRDVLRTYFGSAVCKVLRTHIACLGCSRCLDCEYCKCGNSSKSRLQYDPCN